MSQKQVAFSRNFGELVEHPMTATMPAPADGVRAEFREILPVTEDSRTNLWHTDITCMAVPPTYSLLYGKRPILMEGVDEDTCFCNQYVVNQGDAGLYTKALWHEEELDGSGRVCKHYILYMLQQQMMTLFSALAITALDERAVAPNGISHRKN